MHRELTDRRQFIEQQLFDVQLRLERARVELEVAEHELVVRSADALAAELRRHEAETPVADRACAAARERVAAVADNAARAKALVGDLERTKDGLLDKLVG